MMKIANEINFIHNGDECVLRRFKNEDVHRIFMAWNNPQSYRYNSIDWSEDDIREISEYKFPTEWGMYYMVLENKSRNEIVGTCRFGDYNWESDNTKIWGFGYCVFRGDDKEEYSLDDIRKTYQAGGLTRDNKYQSKGYGQKMLEIILDLAEEKGIEEVRDGADINNDGSLKVMIKNGFKHVMQQDEDGNETNVDDECDYEFSLPLIAGRPPMLNGKAKERAYTKLDEMRNQDRITYKDKKEELDWEHQCKSFMYLMFTKIQKLEKQCLELADIKQHLFEILNQLSNREFDGVFNVINSCDANWKQDNENRKYLNIVKDAMIDFNSEKE